MLGNSSGFKIKLNSNVVLLNVGGVPSSSAQNISIQHTRYSSVQRSDRRILSNSMNSPAMKSASTLDLILNLGDKTHNRSLDRSILSDKSFRIHKNRSGYSSIIRQNQSLYNISQVPSDSFIITQKMQSNRKSSCDVIIRFDQ